MPLPWFRFYHEALEDPKVQRLPHDAFHAWINCLCLAAKNEGYLPDMQSVSFAFHETLERSEKLVEFLIGAGLLDQKRGKLLPHNWFKRQYKSDVSTDRVRRFRERSGNVARNVSKRSQTQTTDTDSDTEQKGTPIPPSGGLSAFMEFWALYPRKIGKGAAEKAWARAKVNGSLEMILTALRDQKTWHQWVRENGQYIPHPATWINQRRWEDQNSEVIIDDFEARKDKLRIERAAKGL